MTTGTKWTLVVVAFLLAFGANRIGRAYGRVAAVEAWAQRITGVVFLLVGLYLTLTVTLKLPSPW